MCLLGTTVVDALFDGQDPTGEMVRVKNIPFRVVGVLARKGSSFTGQDQDDVVVAPYTTVMRMLKGVTKIDFFVASAPSSESIEPAEEEIEALLRQRHHIPQGQESDFLMRSRRRRSHRRPGEASSTLSSLLAALAALSLVVGGIGIVNIMLVSVGERTHEIGLRMAIGARRRDILMQFLVESLALSVTGGLAGIAMGITASRLLAWRAQWPIVVSPLGIAIAFSLSAATGAICGYYPAWRASRMSPIDALRS